MNRAILTQCLVVLAALLVLSGFILMAGKDPFATWTALLAYTLGTWNGFSDVLVNAIPLTLLGLGVAVAFRASIFNIGGDSQLICGAVLAVALAPWLGGLDWLALPLFLAAGCLGGGLAGGMVGWLRTRFGANEIIVTIMMNYVALQMLTWVIRGPLQEPMRIFPHSFVIGEALQLPVLDPGSRLHGGLLLALAAAALLQLVLSRSTFGFRLSVLGENPDAAAYAGIHAGRTVVAGMLLSGAFGGLAGVVEIAGLHYKLEDNFAAGFGLSAIAVALMARLQPWLIPFTALLFGVFYVGSGALQRQMGLPFPLVWIIQGVVILAFLAVGTVQARQVRSG